MLKSIIKWHKTIAMRTLWWHNNSCTKLLNSVQKHESIINNADRRYFFNGLLGVLQRFFMCVIVVPHWGKVNNVHEHCL